MNIEAIFSHMFVKRSFFGLIAYAWGFMLGGSVLMTALTYGLALAGFSRYTVTLLQIAVLVMLLPVAWGTMAIEYQKRGVTNVKTFVAAFFVALFFGTVMPAAIAIGACFTWREELRKKFVHSNYQRRLELTAFMQDLMDRSFLKLAH